MALPIDIHRLLEQHNDLVAQLARLQRRQIRHAKLLVGTLVNAPFEEEIAHSIAADRGYAAKLRDFLPQRIAQLEAALEVAPRERAAAEHEKAVRKEARAMD